MHVVIGEELAVSPEALDVGEQAFLSRRDDDRDAALVQYQVALALVPVMVGMKNGIDLFDTDLPEGVEHRPAAEVDQERPLTLAHYVDVTGIREEE